MIDGLPEDLKKIVDEKGTTQVVEATEEQRLHYEYNNIVADLVNKGKGRFILQIFSTNGQQFHPIMHSKMCECIKRAIHANMEVGPKSVDYQIEWIGVLSSYCVRFIGITNLMWPELFKLVIEDINKNFSMNEFIRR